jgi:3-methyl-2-oxobutanoate hydroxymethyltransferase
MNIHDFQKMKQAGKNISMVTCYDYWSAKIISQTNVDCVLVGDSAAMVMHGAKTTVPATIEQIVTHVTAVAKGMPNKFIIGDMPFCAHRKGLERTMDNIAAMIQAGANAVKIEGACGNEELIKHIVISGIPVMGHLGLTMQQWNQLGGFKVQGRNKIEVEDLLQQAKALENAGCFAIVLECIPTAVAKKITAALTIPTIGIGAGNGVSGQVLVLHDLLGLYDDVKPKFVKKYLDGAALIKNALNKYDAEVKTNKFPTTEHCYYEKN